ncbi:MAG: CvpA family protein [Syntrophobacteraceae bacterium]|jgi:membrane protein required for colicin V production|nr:CvpA family protein [Syntrophobacteraceae bacterium]
MNGLDWALVGMGLLCIGRGVMRGAVSQIFGIGGVVVGFLLAAHYYEPMARQLSRSLPNLAGAQFISFAILFLLTWFCVGVSGLWLSRLMHRSGLGFFDRLWGGMIGCGKGMILAMASVFTLTLFLPSETPLLNRSVLFPYVQEAARLASKATPVAVQRVFEEKRRELEIYWAEVRRDSESVGQDSMNKERKK